MNKTGIIHGSKYLNLLVIFIVLISLEGCSSGKKHEGYLSTSLDEILKDPWKFHGKVVRVTGTFNECKSYSCRICPGEIYKKVYDDTLRRSCMGVSFESRSLEKYARYATVTIEADYDASCASVKKPGEEDIITVCTDRAPQMRNTRVIKIITRRAASQGHISNYGLEPLLFPDNETANTLKTTFIKQLSPDVDIKFSNLEFAYLMDNSQFSDYDERKSITAEGGVCVCEEGEGKCNKIWPILEGHIWGLPTDNPYSCFHAQKINGEWRYPVPQ